MKKIRFAIVAAMTATALATSAASTNPTPVEFRHVGDDGLSEKLADEVEAVFKKSSDLTLSSAKAPGTLVLTIPANVDWKKIGTRTQVLYTVEFSTTAGQIISKNAGHCWDDRLRDCAAQIIGDARIAARRNH